MGDTMKVYILTEWEYDGSEKILDCFTSIDKAKGYLSSLRHSIANWDSREQPDKRIIEFCKIGEFEYYIYELELK